MDADDLAITHLHLIGYATGGEGEFEHSEKILNCTYSYLAKIR